MVSAGFPSNERERLDALRSFEILDNQAEEAFSLVDEARQWFKSRHGIIEAAWGRLP